MIKKDNKLNDRERIFQIYYVLSILLGTCATMSVIIIHYTNIIDIHVVVVAISLPAFAAFGVVFLFIFVLSFKHYITLLVFVLRLKKNFPKEEKIDFRKTLYYVLKTFTPSHTLKLPDIFIGKDGIVLNWNINRLNLRFEIKDESFCSIGQDSLYTKNNFDSPTFNRNEIFAWIQDRR